jgi:hypothetical protein
VRTEVLIKSEGSSPYYKHFSVRSEDLSPHQIRLFHRSRGDRSAEFVDRIARNSVNYDELRFVGAIALTVNNGQLTAGFPTVDNRGLRLDNCRLSVCPPNKSGI